MKLPVKYIILLFALISGIICLFSKSIAVGMSSGGAFVAYAAIEIYDLIIINQSSKEKE